jgi:hypothetical protein
MPKRHSKKCPLCNKITAFYGTESIAPSFAQAGNCWNCSYCGWHKCVYPEQSVMGQYYDAFEDKPEPVTMVVDKSAFIPVSGEGTNPANKFIKTVVFENGPLVGQRASLKDLGYGTSKDQKDWLPGTHSVKIPRSILEEANVFPELELDEYGLHRPLKHRDVVPTKIYYTLHYTTHKGKKAADGTALGTYEVIGYYRVGGSGRNVPVIPDLLAKIAEEKKAFLQKQTEAASKLVGIHVKECEPHGQLCYHTTCNPGIYDHTSTLEAAMHMCYCGNCKQSKRNYVASKPEFVEGTDVEISAELVREFNKIFIHDPELAIKNISPILEKNSNAWKGGQWVQDGNNHNGYSYSGAALHLMGIKVPIDAPISTKFMWKKTEWLA